MIYKNNLTLTIKEIADLKEGHKTLHEITKNHDYSGMIAPLPTKVKGQIYKFNKKRRNAEFMYGIIIDDGGNIVSEKQGNKKREEFHVPDSMKERLKNREQFHKCYNQLTYDEDGEPLGYGACLTYPNISNFFMTQWVHSRDDVTYNYKSITCIGANGSQMTMSVVDEKKFRNALKAVPDDENGLPEEHQVIDPLASRLAGNNGSYNKFVKNCEDSTEKHLEEYTQNAKNNGVNTNTKKFQKQLKKEKKEYQMEYSKQNMEKELSENFKEFEDIGITFTIGWLK